MTKYVLGSGGMKHHLAHKKKFHQEVVTGLDKSPRFVVCLFAQVREDWETKFPSYSQSIAKDMPEGVTPSFTLAMPATFAAQCQEAEVIYFTGGDDYLLQYWMRQYDLNQLFKDRVVATSSASSDMLATHFWTCDWRQCADGLGILPIKFIPHYQSGFGVEDPRGPINWQEAYEQLQAYGDTSLPIYALQEGEYIIKAQ